MKAAAQLFVRSFFSFFMAVFCLAASAQTACDRVSRRTVASISYLSAMEEQGRILISIQRQYGLHQSNLFDYILLCVNIATPIGEKDSLGRIQYRSPKLGIGLADHSVLNIDAASDLRTNEYLPAPAAQDLGYRCGGLNPYPRIVVQEKTSFRMILTPAELEQLLRHKLTHIAVDDQHIAVPDRMSDQLAQQLACIAAAKVYVPVPRHQ